MYRCVISVYQERRWIMLIVKHFVDGLLCNFSSRLIKLSGTILLSSLLIINFSNNACSELPVVTDIRIGTNNDQTRFVIDISESVEFNIFTLPSPFRIVIDLPDVDWNLPSDIMERRSSYSPGIINRFRYGYFRSGLSRIVLDITEPAKVTKSFLLRPNGGKQYRLVIDLEAIAEKKYLDSVELRKKTGAASLDKISKYRIYDILPPRQKPLIGDENTSVVISKKIPVIVIDPGHGGIDPGSTSGRIFEKHITLAAAKEMKKHLESLGRYKVFLTRTKDMFIRLRKRRTIARNYKADLFVSLHADAIRNKNIRGLSIYTLSEKASDREAAYLAEQENKSDLIAGIDLSTESKEVANILIDLAQRETMNESSRLAYELVKYIRKFSRTLSNAHRFAGFAVLKSPDVPSILIEMGFLSNRRDEKVLSNPASRAKLARVIGDAIDFYFRKRK